MIKLEINTREFNDMVARLDLMEKGIPSALKRALNRTIEGARTIATRELGSVTTARRKDIRSAMTLYKASQSRLEAVLEIGGKSIPLSSFSARQTKAGVTTSVFLLGKNRTLFRHAFLRRLASGHDGVFMRKKIGEGKYVGRKPIVQMVGPSPASMAEHTPGLMSKLIEQSGDRLAREVLHELEWLAKGKPSGS